MRLIRLLKNDIAREAAEWVGEEIITLPQAEKICQRYDVDYHQAQSRSLGYNVLIGLGYLFIGLSLITLIGANWDDIPRALRMSGLIALTMAVQGFALRKYLTGDSDVAAGYFLLGNLFYGASIILIAQIYHLGEHMPDGVFWWALGCLPFAILIKSPWVTLQSLLLAMTWFFLEADMGFYPALFPLFILGSLYVLYTGKQSIILFLAVIASIGVWIEYTLGVLWRDDAYFDVQAEHLPVSVALFILAYTISHWLNQKQSPTAKDYGAVLGVWSLRFGLIFLLVMSFKESWRVLFYASWTHQYSMLFITLGLSLVTLLLAYRINKLNPVVYIISVFLVSLLLILVVDNRDYVIYFQIIYNLLLITTGVWLIIRGFNSGISHYFFLGVASILLTAFMRYIDLIGDYIGGSLLFMTMAIVLLGAARYWKNNKLKEGEA